MTPDPFSRLDKVLEDPCRAPKEESRKHEKDESVASKEAPGHEPKESLATFRRLPGRS